LISAGRSRRRGAAVDGDKRYVWNANPLTDWDESMCPEYNAWVFTGYERALAIREKVLGPEHPDTATSLNNLAGLLQDQGDLRGARPLFERALAIYEKVLGPVHPDTATSLNNLAILLDHQRDLAGARPLFERALAIREKCSALSIPNGEEPPATSLDRDHSKSARWRSAKKPRFVFAN
jgi:tetratricopeptide (TPR) repeat protein